MLLANKKMKTKNWPAELPHLKPIEHLSGYLLGEFAKKLGKLYSLVELEERVLAVWENVLAEICIKLILITLDIIKAVIKNNGDPTKY